MNIGTVTTIIMDLDETLIEDSAATERAMERVCDYASQKYSLNSSQLKDAAYQYAERLWMISPTYEYCKFLGISFTEGMWGRFLGDNPVIRPLQQWAPAYQQDIWRLALADQRITDNQLVAELAKIFRQERSRNYRLFPDAEPMLNALRPHYRLALLTNGASDLQREKIEMSGLSASVEECIISGDIGIGKPHPALFMATLERLAVRPEEAVMIGDNPRNDVFGAQQVGIKGIWLNREQRSIPVPYATTISAATTIESLAELTELLLQSSLL